MKFVEELQLICWYPTGVLTEEKIGAYYRALQSCPFGATANRFCDFSRVSSFQVDYPLIRRMVEYRKTHLNGRTDTILVIYSTSPRGYGVAGKYEALMGRWSMDIYVTDDLAEAAQLLRVTPADLQFPEVAEATSFPAEA